MKRIPEHPQPRRPRRRRGLSAVGRVTALIAAALLALPVLAPTAPAAARPRSGSDHSSPAANLRIQVRRVTPSAPLPSLDEQPFEVVLALTNLTGAPLNHVTITGSRGDPIANRDALASALAKPFPPTGLEIGTKRPVTVDLPADNQPHDVVFSTTTGIPTSSGICECHNAVYPLSFTADYTDTDSVTHRLGTTGTYMPAFEQKPSPVHVSWVWPLIDRPHRLTDDHTFVDDDLASSVSFDGRLDRSLSVLERTASSVPLTVVVDPELLDELQVMSTGKYTVQVGRHRVAGKGAAAAGAWLERLRALLQAHPGTKLEATPYGDPDIQSLSMHDLSWKTAMPAAMAQRVDAALGGRALDNKLVWPASGRIGSHTFGRLVTAGVREAVLATASVAPADGTSGSVPAGIARLSRHGHRIGVGLTDPQVQNYVGSVVRRNGPGLTQLPQLMAEIAVRAAQDPSTSHDLVLTPPRYVDADPAVAARAVLDTSRAPFTSPVSLADLLAPDVLPGHVSHLTKITPSVPTLSTRIIGSAQHITARLPTVDSLLGAGAGPRPPFKIGAPAAALLASLPTALQRSESSYWLANPGGGAKFIRQLSGRVRSIISGVRIVKPTSGTYTLASSNSPLPVTVANDLDYPVAVRLKVSTQNGLPGFTARDIGAQRIDPHGQSTLHLPTSIARSGRIQIQAQLLTPAKQSLGQPVALSVHSSAFGVVGVIITIVAGAVLLLALLLRALRWLRRRQRSQRPEYPPGAGTEAPAETGPAQTGEPDDALTTPASTSTGPAP